jgi:hypothetical protein
MPTAPLPPFLPKDLEAFSQHIPDHVSEWFKYFCEVYEYAGSAETAVTDAKDEVNQSYLRSQALEQELVHSRREHELEKSQKDAVISYQKGQAQEITRELVKALKERDKAITLATPTVNTPLSVPVPEILTEKPTAPAARTPPPTVSASSHSTRISERLPDPDKFEGSRKDLRRFTHQIRDKIITNRDRFLTPQTRITYVTSRLGALPHAHIIP